MTVLYTYRLNSSELNDLVPFGQTHQVNRLESLDQVPRQLERPSVIFLSDADQSLGVILNRVAQLQPALTPIILSSSPDTLKSNLPENYAKDADVWFLPLATTTDADFRLARALEYSHLRIQQNTSSYIDDTSGLFSYGYYLRRLKEEMSYARRHQSPLTCVVIKFAFYEAYLDSYGYEFIEKLYGKMAAIVRDTIRQEDIAARLGDDEIGLLLPKSTEKGALVLAKRLMERIGKVELMPNDLGESEHVFTFAGIAAYPNPDLSEPDPDTLLRFTRHALHQARCSAEENAIVMFSQMHPSSPLWGESR
jgi:diguanylate cyclase (GGDEF)-like protein